MLVIATIVTAQSKQLAAGPGRVVVVAVVARPAPKWAVIVVINAWTNGSPSAANHGLINQLAPFPVADTAVGVTLNSQWQVRQLS